MSQKNSTIYCLFINYVYVVLYFYRKKFFFVFFLFLGIVIYVNEVETNEKLKLPEIKK